ncbi:hypothetical protein AA313_de0203133 [Arthrobotrys entomopaga]|nr:hypothetical protein AA313_de0203133 [Arthrobotrys entomopaga]
MAACDTWLLKLGLMGSHHTYNQELANLSSDPGKNIFVLKIVYSVVFQYYTSLWLVKVRVTVLADTSALTHVAVWSAVEVAVGIIIASLPSLRVLIWKKGGLISVNSTAQSGDLAESGITYTNNSRRGGTLDWISLEEKGDVDTLKSRNRDTIKSHSTVITIPTVEELEEIVCENGETPTIRSINDLQKYHDSIRPNRDPSDPSPKTTHEWTFDKVQWRYSEPEPPTINFHGLGVIPDVPPLPPIPPLPVRTVQQSRRSR